MPRPVAASPRRSMRPWDPSRNSCVPVLAPDGGAFVPLARTRHWIAPSPGNAVSARRWNHRLREMVRDCENFQRLAVPGARARATVPREAGVAIHSAPCARASGCPFVLLPVARLSMMAAPRTGLARHLRRKPLKEKRLGQAERRPSGRRRAPAKGVRVKSPSRVRIPLSPPDLKK